MKLIHHSSLIEVYKSFEIMKYRQSAQQTEYYRIFKNKELVSLIVAGSPKGCKNIINSFLRNTA